MDLHTYLGFDGTCREAFAFYERLLGGKIKTMMRTGDTPMADQTPADWQDRIMHAYLEVGDAALMGGDAPPGQYERPQGFNVAITFEDTAEAERVFTALADGGTVRMPFRATFWAERFGMVTDRFGTPWIVNGGRPG